MNTSDFASIPDGLLDDIRQSLSALANGKGMAGVARHALDELARLGPSLEPEDWLVLLTVARMRALINLHSFAEARPEAGG